jgi:sulfur carrier protein
VKVVLNGKVREIPAGSTLGDLLRNLELPAGRVAVERNHQVVPRGSLETILLEEGDRLELVHFVGGG